MAIALIERFDRTLEGGLIPYLSAASISQIYQAVKGWRTMARSTQVDLTAEELDDFAPAFEHEALEEARAAPSPRH